MLIDLAQHFGLSENPFRPREGRVEAMVPTSLNQDQARDFIRTHLAGAGAIPGLFSRAALDEVVSAAGGISHRLRWLAGLAMVEAALEGARTVEDTHVRAAMAQARIAAMPSSDEAAPIARRSWLPPWMVSGLTAATVIVLALLIGVSLVGPARVNTVPAARSALHRRALLPPTEGAGEASAEPLTIPVAGPPPGPKPAWPVTPSTAQFGVNAVTDEPIKRERSAAAPIVRTSAPLPAYSPIREPIIVSESRTHGAGPARHHASAGLFRQHQTMTAY